MHYKGQMLNTLLYSDKLDVVETRKNGSAFLILIFLNNISNDETQNVVSLPVLLYRCYQLRPKLLKICVVRRQLGQERVGAGG